MKNPNILVIHTDQQNCWTLGCYGGTLVQTPHVDRLAREGVRFDQFFTNSAICTPSRGCFVTGRYPESHGAWKNNLCLHNDEVTFAEALRRTGYETGYAGKWHLDGDPRPGWVHPERSMGFEERRHMFNRGHWKCIEGVERKDMEPTVLPYDVIGDEKTYTTDWLADRTIEFLGRPHTKPFCFMVSIPDPHEPHTVRPPYDAMYDPGMMPVPETFREPGIPSWAEKTRIRNRWYRSGDPEETLRRCMAIYCGMSKLIDDAVGRILGELERLGILDDTIVVFTTDHGDYMGEHGLSDKNHLYEGVYRIPLVVRFPAKIRRGTVVRELVSTVDFQPTLLSLAGPGPHGREEGKDASRLLVGDSAKWANEVQIHHSSQEAVGIFTSEWELACWKDAESILFDRKNDPQQVRNLFGDPARRDVVRDLSKRILRHHEKVGSPAATWLKAALTAAR